MSIRKMWITNMRVLQEKRGIIDAGAFPLRFIATNGGE